MRLLENHPSLGYVGGLVAALPPWVVDMREWVGIAGAIVGLALGLVTLAIQCRIWSRGRRDRPR